MHNMIVEDEGEGVTSWDDEDTVGPSFVMACEPQNQGLPHDYNHIVRAFVNTREEQVHNPLKRDLIQEVWAHNH